MRLYDSHNHLQDERFAGRQETCVAEAEQRGVVRMVVNGCCEADWPRVQALASAHPMVLPSFGYHPWHVKDRTVDWQANLVSVLDESRGAIGEIGLDRWIPDPDLPQQEEALCWQLRLAAERNLPASIHCLRAWGRLEELLRSEPRPARGFLLHSYGGPSEMVMPLVRLGAYFSFSGYFLHERKSRARDTFRHVPRERLLIETDAPDQPLPDRRILAALTDPTTGQPINHPANLPAVYTGLAEFLGEPVETLAETVEQNFIRLFLS